ncbi:MAG: phosphotransferase [Deltaproteobacteria bacterium]|nr:phosphotransferase [Deltaproteobacteria bacterium]
MKALIFAAGYGTRLRPHTNALPKPLFTIQNTPIIDITVNKLINAGFTELIINTHHLALQIKSYILSKRYPVKINILYEPQPLDTAGAIKNAAKFLNDSPFLTINADIITDIDIKQVYNFHKTHPFLVTAVMRDCPQFNKVTIDKNHFIKNFRSNNLQNKPIKPLHNKKNGQNKNADNRKLFTYTGISVINPQIIKTIPSNKAIGLIETFQKLITLQKPIKAFITKNYWQDIGTPQSYKKAVFNTLTQSVFKTPLKNITVEKLKGDGSDRTWRRVSAKGEKSIIAAEDTININTNSSQTNSFVKIGKYLHQKQIPVPEIAAYDTIAGFVFSEDLGDIRLKDIIVKENNINKIISLYKKVINLLITFCIKGKENFNTTLCFQTPYYNKNLILDKECRYFTDSFLNGYLKLQLTYSDFAKEFNNLADNATNSALFGLMHRDMQSANIMIYKNKIYFIDFQSAKIGPIEYDLASLLIDPYVNLSRGIQKILFNYTVKQLLNYAEFNKEKFLKCFKACLITRNLQILGAFGFLTLKGKTNFKRYIPAALKSLHSNIDKTDNKKLLSVINKINPLA